MKARRRYQIAFFALGWLIAIGLLFQMGLGSGFQSLYDAFGNRALRLAQSFSDAEGNALHSVRHTSRAEYLQRRDLLLAGLNELGLRCAPPAGAFYAFPDISTIGSDSRQASELLLDRAQVATVPGVVFGPHGEGHVRFSFSTSIETIESGLESMRRNL